MENVLTIAILITVFFCLAKFVEMKFIDKELKPLKFMMRDVLIVFVSSVAASFIYFNMNGNLADFMNVMTDIKTAPVGGATEIFTDSPGF